MTVGSAAARPSAPRIANVILRVSDLKRSSEFYRTILGLIQTGEADGEFVFLDGGGVTLALRETPQGVPIHPGDTEVSFEAEDVFSAVETLRARGLAIAKPLRVVTSSGGRNLFATDFTDPDGHVLSVTGWSSEAR